MADAQPLVYLVLFFNRKKREKEKLVIVTSNNSHRIEEPYPFLFFSGCSSAPTVQLYRNYRKAFSVFRQTFYAGRIGLKYATTATMTITDYYYDGCYVVQHKLRLPTTVTTCPTSHSVAMTAKQFNEFPTK